MVTLPQASVKQIKPASTGKRKIQLNAAYAFLFPYLAVMFLFGIAPAIYAFIVSFSSFEMGKPQFFKAGFQNFVVAYGDFRFLEAFKNTLSFVVLSLPVGLVFAISMALILHITRDKITSIVRTIYFLAGAVSGPVLVLIFVFVFDPPISPFGFLFKPFGFTQPDQIITSKTIIPIFVLLRLFWSAGGSIAIFYGALQGISTEIIEAALIDGCNVWKLAWFIKIPLLKAWTLNALINAFVFDMQIYTEPALIGPALEGRSPVNAYWSLNMLGAQFTQYGGNFGASGAISLLQVAISFIAAYFIVSRSKFYETDLT
jgi:multiple sugar transport system permease protein